MKAEMISAFMKKNFRHFNAASLVRAADAYKRFVASGGRMIMTLAGAMSTAELGLCLAEMIRRDKVHAICCTGANLEEDIYNLVAHEHYVRIPDYRSLTAKDEQQLLERRLNRVTDTCIPENEAILRIEKLMVEEWLAAEQEGARYYPHEFFYRLISQRKLEPYYQINPRDSWVVASCEKNLPIFVPGWEDSSLGNIYAGLCAKQTVRNVHTVRGGIEHMMSLAGWYRKTSESSDVGFFQIGGGIAGDFAICVVPMLRQDMKLKNVKLWKYFCQISDSTTSHGSYSGAVPNEKITWGKLDIDSPKFIIESDATIVAPLIFAYVLEDLC